MKLGLADHPFSFRAPESVPCRVQRRLPQATRDGTEMTQLHGRETNSSGIIARSGMCGTRDKRDVHERLMPCAFNLVKGFGLQKGNVETIRSVNPERSQLHPSSLTSTVHQTDCRLHALRLMHRYASSSLALSLVGQGESHGLLGPCCQRRFDTHQQTKQGTIEALP